MSSETVVTSATISSNTSAFKLIRLLPQYRLLLLGQLVSNLGDGVYSMALLLAMKQLTGSAVQLSIVMAAEILTRILVGIFAGALVDRGRKKHYLLTSDFCRGLIVAVLAVLWLVHQMHPWMLIAAAVLLSFFTTFFGPARTVATRTLVPKETLLQAQSLSSTINTSMMLIAPTIGALLCTRNIGYGMLLDAVSFFLSFLFLARIRQAQLVAKPTEPLKLDSLKRSLAEGFRTIFTTKVLFWLVIYAAMLNFMFAPVATLIPMLAATPAQLAFFETAAGIGGLLGSLAVGLFGKVRKMVLVLVGILVVVIALGSIAFLQSYLLISLALFVVSFALMFCNIPLNALFVTIVPREVLGRASSTMGIFVNGAQPISLSLVSTLLLVFSIRDMFLGMLIVGLLVFLALALNPVIRQVKE